jgi:putative PLP-dependent aminotransferase (TIGR04422 family)
MYSDKNKKHFLWPKSKTLSLGNFLQKTSANDVEMIIQKNWPNTFPVLFSSSRASLTAILQHLNLTRPDLVWCPPYSSHCLFDSIGRVATPITEPSNDVKAALIYHQWGFSCSHQCDPRATTIIEDSVDTMFLPKADVFSGNGRFVLQSLPKVYGCIFGGVVFCRNYDDYLALINIRNKRGSSLTQSFLRALPQKMRKAYLYWHGAESLQGGLPNFALSHVYSILKDLNKTTNDRLELLSEVSNDLADYAINSGRIPSNLPLIVNHEIEQIYLSSDFISSGLRHFNISRSAPNIKWKLVAPLPLHIDIRYKDLCKLFPSLKNKSEVKDEFGFL